MSPFLGRDGALGLRPAKCPEIRPSLLDGSRAERRPVAHRSAFPRHRANAVHLASSFLRHARPYPRPPNLGYNASTSSVEGRSHEAFVMAGRGAAPAGFVTQRSSRAAPGHPPGPLRAPARSSLTPAGKSRPAEKAGPGRRPTPQIACATASLLERMWRAGRRQRDPCDRDTDYGLRLAARHPPRAARGGSRPGCGRIAATPPPERGREKRRNGLLPNGR